MYPNVKSNFVFRFYVYKHSRQVEMMFVNCIACCFNFYIHLYLEYTDLGGNEEIPLGEEFQSLVKRFVNHNEKKPEKRYEGACILIEQLKYDLLWTCIKSRYCTSPKLRDRSFFLFS